MNIVSENASSAAVLKLFSEHDDFMQDFLGEDRSCYTRYTSAENIEKVWVAYLDNTEIGCVAYRRKSDDTGEVKRLFIRRKYRGWGISKALLGEVKRHAKAEGCTKLFLGTRITLEPAVSLYRSFGFEITFRQGLYIQMELDI